MKTKTLVSFGALLALLPTINYQLSATPLGTAFTYQGKLSSGLGAANGIYDFRFLLWDSASNGAPVSARFEVTNTIVTNGVFTVTLDFGAGSFGSDTRWLEIGVRTNGSGGASCSSIGGGVANSIATNAHHSVVSGGGGNSIGTNADHATISCGRYNSIGANAAYAFVGCGSNNVNEAACSVIVGGERNTIEPYADHSTIGGGYTNAIQTNAYYAAIGGGCVNTVDADGVALPAIQGLNQKLEAMVQAKDAEIQSLKQRLERLEQLLTQRQGEGQ
jgi:hypothetical protein